MNTNNNIINYSIYDLIDLPETDPVFDHIRKQRFASIQIHQLSGKQIVNKYYLALQAENLVKNMLTYRDGYHRDHLFNNKESYVNARFLDENRSIYKVSKDDSPVIMYNAAPDIQASGLFHVDNIEVKCMSVDADYAMRCWNKNIWNPFHRYFTNHDTDYTQPDLFDFFSSRYTHGADIVVIVPTKDNKLLDKELGIMWYRTKDASYTIKEYPQGGGYRFMIKGNWYMSELSLHPDYEKYMEKDK